MDQVRTILDMGGYAVFVWSAYGLATAGIVGVWYIYRRTMKTRQAELDLLRPPRDANATEQDAS